MGWVTKKAICDWCDKELEGIFEDIFESEKGTLCDNCEKGRLEEARIYAEESGDRRIQREIDREIAKAAKRAIGGDDAETEPEEGNNP
ncbi:MAG: hypothetical protein UX36_C0006G0011 [Microgenomates group bacterium GW2011_GWC1_46_15]|nr:MAG: hypothetical protein UX36_C0006G0011 [Microgenomates group bacterium GW2011_GWC1_46_15]